MNLNLQTMLKAIYAAVAIGVFSAAITGCHPETLEEDHTSKFKGTWNGTCVCSGGLTGLAQFVFTAANKKEINTLYSIGDSSCGIATNALGGYATGNTMTFPTATMSDNCGNVHKVSGSGTLSGNTLTFTYTETGTVNGTCTFTGIK